MTQQPSALSGTKPAYTYARFSTAEQAKGYSLERQLSHAKTYIESKGWQLVGELTDEGRSAFHGSNRDEGATLFEFEKKARLGHFKNGAVLVVENIDRLSRQGPRAAAQLIWALNENGVDVATYHDDQIYKSDASDMLEIFGLIIKASVAYDESEKKSKRTKASWDKRYADIAAGSKKAITSQVPAWLTVDANNDFQTNQQRASVVQEIFKWYVDGVGLHTIMKTLNERGEPAFSGKETSKGWSKSAVNHILTNRSVLGEFAPQSGKSIPVQYYPQIITLDLFNRAEAMRATKTRTGGSSKYRGNNLFAGIAKCLHCDGPMGFVRDGGISRYVAKSGELRMYASSGKSYLICDAARRGFGCDNKTHVPYPVIEEAVLERVLWAAVEEEDEADPKADAIRAKMDVTRHSIDLKNRQMANIIESMADTPSKVMAARVAVLESEVEDHRGELEKLEKELAIQTAAPSSFDDIEELRVLNDLLQCEDADIKQAARLKTNAALRRIIDYMRADREGHVTVFALDIAVWEFDKQGKCIGGQAL